MSEFSSLREMSAELAKGAYSSVELTQAHLERIQTANAALNCFISINAESALAAATKADTTDRGPHWVPPPPPP